MAVHAHPTDPRDITWEGHAGTYRVYFWDPAGACAEWRLTGVTNVYEVLDWASAHRAPGHRVQIFIEIEHTTRGMLQINGAGPQPPVDAADPPRSDSTSVFGCGHAPGPDPAPDSGREH